MIKPLSQVFTIPPEFARGTYVTAIEVYFTNKAVDTPITIEIGPTVNGVPDFTTLYPDASKVLYPNSITIDGTPTKFVFEVPVYLLPGTHYFALKSNTKEYVVATAIIGQDISDNRGIVSRHSFVGPIFKPSVSEPTPSDSEFLKFNMYRCLFDTTTGESSGNVVLKNDFKTITTYTNDLEDVDGNLIGQETITQDSVAASFSTFNVYADFIKHDPTNISFGYKKTNLSNQLDASFTPYLINSNKTIEKSTLNLETFQLNTTLQTTNNAVCPVLDLNRVHGAFISNKVNFDETGEDSNVGGNASSKYVTKVIELSPGIDANDVIAYAYLMLPTGTDVNIYYKVASTGVDITTSNYVKLSKKELSPKNNKEFVEYKFYTPDEEAITGGAAFNKFMFKIVMLSSDERIVPKVKDFRGIALFE